MIKTFSLNGVRSYLKIALVSGVLLLLAGCAQQTTPAPEEPAPSPAEPVADEQQPQVEIQAVSYNANQSRIVIQASGSQIKTVLDTTFTQIISVFTDTLRDNIKTNVSNEICDRLENRLPQSVDEQKCKQETADAISDRIAQIKARATSLKTEVNGEAIATLANWLRENQGTLTDFFGTIRSLLSVYDKGNKVEDLAALVKYILSSDTNVVRNAVNAITPGTINVDLDDAVFLNLLIGLLENKDASFVFSFFDNVKEGEGCEVKTQAANPPLKPSLDTRKKTVHSLAANAQIFNLNTVIQLIDNGGIYDKIRTFMCQGDQQCLDSWSNLQQQRKDRLASHVQTLQSILTALSDAMDNLRSAINVSPDGTVKNNMIALFNQVQGAMDEIIKAIDERRDPGQAIVRAQEAWANFVSYVEQNAGPAVKAAIANVKTRLEGLQTTIDIVGNVNPQAWIANTCRL